jgi:hypothetical protein
VPVIDVRPRGWDKADRRLVIYVHGGALTVNSARSTVAKAARLAAKSGIRVISVNYTPAPAANWKIIQEQVLSVSDRPIPFGASPGAPRTSSLGVHIAARDAEQPALIQSHHAGRSPHKNKRALQNQT